MEHVITRTAKTATPATSVQSTRSEQLAGQAPHPFSTEDLSIYYGSFEAVKKVNLAFPEQTVTALIGPSGCGKSTFLRSLNRMNDEIASSSTTGHIWMDGQDLTAPETDVIKLRQQIGMVWQRPNPFYKSIYNNIAFGPKYRGVRKRSSSMKSSKAACVRRHYGMRSRIVFTIRLLLCLAGNSSGFVLHVHFPFNRKFCCLTSLLPRWTLCLQARWKSLLPN